MGAIGFVGAKVAVYQPFVKRIFMMRS